MNKASYKDLIYKKADSYLVPEDYDKETFRERVSLEPSDITKLKEAYKTIEEIAAKAPASKGLSNALEALKRGIDIEISWTSFQKAVPQKMAKDQYRDQIFKKADVFPAGSPANSPIGQAVMNTVMPGVGTAAKETNEAFGKDELDTPHSHGKGLTEYNHSHKGGEVRHRHDFVTGENIPITKSQGKYLDSLDEHLWSKPPRPDGDLLLGKSKETIMNKRSQFNEVENKAMELWRSGDKAAFEQFVRTNLPDQVKDLPALLETMVVPTAPTKDEEGLLREISRAKYQKLIYRKNK
jgi:hypothetical protein